MESLEDAQATVGQDELLARYLRIGGFPVLHALDYDEESAASYTAMLVDAILMRDVVHRHSIRRPDSASTIEREFAAPEAVDDQYPVRLREAVSERRS